VAAVAGVEPKDLDVQVTPEDVRSVHLPDKIDPDSAKAEYRNGMLRLTAAVAKAAPKKVDVHAA
jgi:HSP20 family molecular chaperone IbpA